ncbi:MAG: RNA polymerase sigma factor (sigma-70 family), partial [Chitinophagales bacterium]
ENLEYHEADLISDQLSGFEKLALEDQRECINLALEQLNTLDALIISLFYMEEQSIEELEVLTGLSRSNVKVKLHRARKKLKEIMEQSFSSKLNQQ